MQSRIGCQNCRKKSFLSLAASEQQLKHSGRARTYAKYAFRIEEKILKAARISTLHACSDSCLEEMKDARKGYKHIRKDVVKNMTIMLKNAIKNRDLASIQYSESIMLNGLDVDVTFRKKIKLDHYSRLVAQRMRRLNEYKSGQGNSSNS